MMDPLGLSLENFDMVGRWRDVDEALVPIDASGALPDGTTFEGPAGLRAILLSHPDRFVRTLTEKMLIYALGRGLEYYDMPAVRAIDTRSRQAELPCIFSRRRGRQESSISDAEAAVMIITKMALPRRTFLRGIGATFALPLLDAMVPAFSATVKSAAKPVCRIGFIYVPNGVAMNDTLNYWTPKGAGAAFELSPILAPLAPYRDRLTIVSGLAQKQGESLGDGNGEHTRACATWLAGVHPKKTEGADIRLTTTADQIAAAQLGKETVLPSMEMISSEIDLVLGGQCEAGYSCAYMNTVSWQSPTTPLPVENNPSVVFDRLFGEGGNPEERLDRMKRKRSLLDRVNSDLARLQTSLGPGDRLRITEYLDAVREVERRIQMAEAQNSNSALPVPDRPIGIPVAVRRSFEAAVRLAVAGLSRAT